MSNQKSAESALGVADCSEWIACAEKLPSLADANDLGEVWWWIPRHASHGPQRDYWHEPEDATHWMRCNDGYADDDDRHSPPNAKAQP